jgi:signal recognition particle receptor subunit beta
MGAGCSIICSGQNRVAPALGEYPAIRRVLFCGMGRSGKSTLIRWVINATNVSEDTDNNSQPTNVTDTNVGTTIVPRTTDSKIHIFGDNVLALVDTPDMLKLDGQTIVLDAVAEERVAAVVFVVDVTDHIRGVLAEELLRNTLKRLKARTREGVLVLIVGNQRYPNDPVLIDIGSYPTLLPAEILKHYTVQTMSFSNESDITNLINNMQPL